MRNGLFCLLRVCIVCIVLPSFGTLVEFERVEGQEYHPNHPEVVAMVDRGIAYLKELDPLKMGTGQSAIGSEFLMAYTIYKVEGDPDQKLVAGTVRAARDYVDQMTSARSYSNKSIYELAVACMLLASVDVDTYLPQLTKARDLFLRYQRSTGGFGYIDGSHREESSDISQTQYVLLALWTMSQVGIEIPQDKVVRAIQYLMESQMKSGMPTQVGGWPYQYEGRIAPNAVTTRSLTAAGLSAILIAGDTLGLYRNRLAESEEEDGIIPAAFKRILTEAEKPEKTSGFDREKIDATVNLGLAYNRNNAYIKTTWHYYYLYSVERFESFLEIANRKQQKSPPWYNEEVARMKAAQGADGSWGGAADVDVALSPSNCTCFAILFLIRSTQKAIGDLKEGVVRGWAELPEDLSAVTLVNGKPVNKTEATSIDDALKMLEGDKASQGEDRLVSDKVVFSKDPARRKDELNRFARLLRSRDYQARRVAAKVLGRSDDMDVVPELIYALSDPDSMVSRNAETSLRLISRQLDKYHLPKEGAITDQQRIVAKREWQTWYQALRPDYIFVE